MNLEIVATRDGEDGMTEYLVVFQDQGYIVDDLGAFRVSVNTALSSDEWGGDVPSMTFELADKLTSRIREAQAHAMAREGRLVQSGLQ